MFKHKAATDAKEEVKSEEAVVVEDKVEAPAAEEKADDAEEKKSAE